MTQPGDPLSWRHFRYGMDRIRRESALSEYQMLIAARMAQATDDKLIQQYMSDLRALAGFTI